MADPKKILPDLDGMERPTLPLKGADIHLLPCLTASDIRVKRRTLVGGVGWKAPRFLLLSEVVTQYYFWQAESH